MIISQIEVMWDAEVVRPNASPAQELIRRYALLIGTVEWGGDPEPQNLFS